MSVERRRQIIEPEHPRLSVVRQRELVSISRSGFYYRPAGETQLNLALMRLIDGQFLGTPWYGSRQMASHGLSGQPQAVLSVLLCKTAAPQSGHGMRMMFDVTNPVEGAHQDQKRKWEHGV
jgi:hypothetical protein